MIVFSFWPDVIMIKEVGDPLTFTLAEYLGLDNEEFQARIILAQGRQNTNYAIDIYAFHQSDSEVLTHTLHSAQKKLGMELDMYMHILTPLKDEELDRHPNGDRLRAFKHSCRPLIIDGPNCVIGCLPDRSVFMVQGSKKLRPGIVGGTCGMFALSSEMCGLDAAIPARNKSEYFQPMKYDTVMIPPDRQEVVMWNQWER